MQKIIFILSTFLIVALYLWERENLSIGNKSIKTSQIPSHIQQQSVKSHKIKDTPLLSSKKDALIDDLTYEPFEEEAIDFVADKREKIKGVIPLSAVRMKKDSIKNMKIGDTLALPSIAGNTYTLQVTNRSLSKRGNVSINGNFRDNGSLYTTILTEGESSAYISLNTPEGSYEVIIQNGLGFVYSSAEIEKVRIDYTKSDQIRYH